MRFSNLNDWLLWQQNVHAKAIDLGLERVSKVAEALGLLQPQSAQVITVAGTNGKGSCVAALEAVLTAAGKRCGAYTSPHLLRYNERVRIDSQQVSDADLCQAFEDIDQARGDISLTYFEFGTLAALHLFAREPLDYWLLEVGLGGRLDATNIIDADVAVVTSIDLDHMEWLGNNREDIGREKAGIFRAKHPAVCADAQAPKSVVDQAERLECAFSVIGKDFGFRDENGQVIFWSDISVSAPVAVTLPKPSLAAAYHVAHILKLPQASDLASVFANLNLPGRMQRVYHKGASILLDVAHNPAATAQLARNLTQQVREGRVAAVVAMMGDKNLVQSLAPLCLLVDEWALCTIHDLPRAATTEALAAALPVDSCKHAYTSVANALAELTRRAEFELILVTGSFYTVAEAQCWLEQNWNLHEAAG